MKVRIIAMVAALSLLTSGLVYGNDHTDEDSINVAMDLDIDTKKYREVRGGTVRKVRFYTTDQKSVIMWSDGRDNYRYMIRDYNHEKRGLELLDRITRGGMVSYVFERSPEKTVRLSKYYRVIALQIKPISRK